MARSSEPITFLLLLVCLESVKGYPGGAPDTACDLMAPDTRQPPTGHGAPRQTGASPYDVAITVPDRIAKTGQNYPVTIKSDDANTTFKGFMCQVRKNTTTDRVGSFSTFNTTVARTGTCSGNTKAYVTHKNASRFTFTTFSATWQAPSSISDDFYHLQAYCTVVKEKITYWVKVPSSSFTLKASGRSTAIAVPSSKAPEVSATMTVGPASRAVGSFGIICLALLLRVLFF